MTPEKTIENAIIDYLRLHKWFVFRIHNITQYDHHKGIYRAPGKGYVHGVADLCCIKDQKVVFVEVKTPRGKQSPQQKSFQSRLELEGVQYILARSIEDVAVLCG